ncbi:MAG TPA: phenylalanine--tRNA ligase subunit beta [Nocardioidaceae bacterium]|nr:phenylalanine--tRNA ligase subunit beta [Nocardioidaceae bacterium]
MKAPLSWIREYVDLPADVTAESLAHELTALGLKLEALHGADVSGPLVVGRVLSFVDEPQKNGKTIRWCRVDVGPAQNDADGGRGIVCGARNFAVDDLVVCVLPGAVLPGGFEITARKTYGHVSDGMICSTRELGIGDDHAGILVLGDAYDAKPGDDAIALLGLDDTVIEFEINPDRAYALSLRGVAREAALAYDAPYHDPAHRDVPEPNDGGYPVQIDDSSGCPVFATRTVTGFDPSAPSPKHLAARVQAAGMRSISLAVDVTNYVMLELGQPIHAYDAQKLQGPIVVRRAGAGEKLTTLDDVQRTLSDDDLLITDDSGPIGLAGVMGGATTEISSSTTDIVIEAAHFEPTTIFRTQRRHKLPSEASKRFERGVDPLLPAYAADRVATLLVEHGGGRIEEGVTYVGSPPPAVTIQVPVDLPARITGMAIDAETTVKHLKAVGCVVNVQDGVLTALAPTWRPDLTDPYDLVEEVARIVGYENVPSVLPAAPAGRGLTREQKLRRRAGLALAGFGLAEVKTYPFVGVGDFDALSLGADDERRRTVDIANPLSEEEPSLTTTLLPGLLKVAARNVGRGISDLGVFETAAVFQPTESGAAAPILGVDTRPEDAGLAALFAAIPAQPRHLGIVLTGERESSGWWGSGRAATWADAIQAVREVARVLGVDVEVSTANRAPWHPGRCAAFSVGERIVGYAGELHPNVCKSYGVPPRTSAAEIDLDAFVGASTELTKAPVFSNMPVAKEDVALVVDADVSADAVEATLREGAGALLESIRLFDVYTGAQIGEGKKSLAFALRFRAADRTLTEQDTSAARDAAVALAAERHGAVQRT